MVSPLQGAEIIAEEKKGTLRKKGEREKRRRRGLLDIVTQRIEKQVPEKERNDPKILR